MPKPTVTVYLKRLVAAKLVRREIDADDLRRHRLNLTPAGRRVMVRGLVISLEISKKALYILWKVFWADLSSRRPMPIIEFLAINVTGTQAS